MSKNTPGAGFGSDSLTDLVATVNKMSLNHTGT